MRITYGDLVEARKCMERFKKPKTDEEIFYNLCLCIMVPQATFKNCMVALNRLKEYGFYEWSGFPSEMETKELIKPCRFYNRKAEYLLEAKKIFPEILWRLRMRAEENNWNFANFFIRDWLVKNVKGLGMKTASHLLRNIGCTNLAIIDTHILKYFGLKGEKWNYLDLEKKLKKRAKRYFISLAELDIIIWKHYSKTDWKDYIY